MKDLLIGLGLLSCPAAVFVAFGTSGLDAFDEGAGPPVSSLSVQVGGVLFVEGCARCHGRTARGTERGPNLVQRIYGPRSRSDAQFRRAVREGRRARQAGHEDMPAAGDISERELNRLIVFLREVQRVNGIR